MGETDGLARRVAQRVVGGRQAEHALLDAGHVALVDQDVGREQQRQLAQTAIGLRATERIEGGERFVALALLGEQAGLLELGQHRIAARSLGNDGIECLLGAGNIAAVIEVECRIELI